MYWFSYLSLNQARLQEHMGDKYTTYSVKARQLKFFEENVSFWGLF